MLLSVIEWTTTILILAAIPNPAAAQNAYKQEYLNELNYTGNNALQLAESVPAGKYAWRPVDGVRSTSELYMHIAAGNFLLLDIVGSPVPGDVYARFRIGAADQPNAIAKANQQLEKSITKKEDVIRLAKRSLDAARDAFTRSTAADLDRQVDFFGHPASVRAVFLRLLAHLNEHHGQAIAYARSCGVVPPWSAVQSKMK